MTILFLGLCVFLKFLTEAGIYETKEEASKREEVLQRIGQVITDDLNKLCARKTN